MRKASSFIRHSWLLRDISDQWKTTLTELLLYELNTFTRVSLKQTDHRSYSSHVMHTCRQRYHSVWRRLLAIHAPSRCTTKIEIFASVFFYENILSVRILRGVMRVLSFYVISCASNCSEDDNLLHSGQKSGFSISRGVVQIRAQRTLKCLCWQMASCRAPPVRAQCLQQAHWPPRLSAHSTAKRPHRLIMQNTNRLFLSSRTWNVAKDTKI